MGVNRVGICCRNECRLFNLHFFVRFRIVQIPNHNIDTLIVKLLCMRQIWREEIVGIVVAIQLVDEGLCNGIIVRQQNMLSRAAGQLTRRTGFGLGLNPRCVKKLNKSKGQNDKQKNHAGQQNDHRE